MKSSPSERLSGAPARLGLTLLLAGASAHAQSAPPPPASSAQTAADSVVLPSARAREPLAEPQTVKVRIHGEYEVRQSFLTALPLTPYAGGPAHLEQTSRLFHWLRVRPLALFGEHWELRGELDLPRGMVYGVVPAGIPDSGTEFDEQQPVRLHARMLRLTARNDLGEVTLGHTTTSHGMGLVDDDGDAPRWFGTPDRPSTFERVQLTSGTPSSTLRVGLSGDLAFQDERLSLVEGDHKWRVGLSGRYAPSRRAHLAVLARYEALQARGSLGGARTFLFDAYGGFQSPLPGRSGELFGAYEAAYRVGDVNEPLPLAQRQGQVTVTELAFAARLGFALERLENEQRYAHVVVSLEWGMASGDADVIDDEQHRFVMNPNHGVGLLLFGELLRFKTSRAQALLEASNPAGAAARSWGLATRGGVAGASYLNPVLVVRPLPALSLKAGAVVASSTTDVVDPAALSARRERQNYDGGPVSGRSLGSELDVGAELRIPLDPPMELRLSVEAGVAFPGSAFADASGNHLGTQALTTAGLGLTF